MEQKITSRITVGVIIVAVLVILDIILQKSFAVVPDRTRYLPRLAITFTGVLAACILYSKQSGGGLAFGEVFSHGFRTTAVISFLMALYTFIAVKWIYAAPTTAEMELAVQLIQQQGNALYEEAKQQAGQAAKNRWIVYVSLAIFGSLIPGLLASLTGAAVTKKKP